MELQQVFEYKNFKVELYYNGSDKMPNKAFIDEIEVYNDNTFRPSPLIEIGTECMVALLFFLTLSIDGTDPDYFESRDCEELDNFSETDVCEEIRMMVNDFESSYDESFLTENEITLEYARRIEQYIKIY